MGKRKRDYKLDLEVEKDEDLHRDKVGHFQGSFFLTIYNGSIDEYSNYLLFECNKRLKILLDGKLLNKEPMEMITTRRLLKMGAGEARKFLVTWVYSSSTWSEILITVMYKREKSERLSFC